MNSEEILKDLELATKRCSDYIIYTEKISKQNEELTRNVELLKTDNLIIFSENEENKKNNRKGNGNWIFKFENTKIKKRNFTT